jgi:hypothetical protein
MRNVSAKDGPDIPMGQDLLVITDLRARIV